MLLGTSLLSQRYRLCTGAPAAIGDGSITESKDLHSCLNDKNLAPEQMHKCLQQAKDNAECSSKHWQKLDVVYQIDPSKQLSGKQAKLQCRDCGSCLSGSNPGRLAKEHFSDGVCKTWNKLQQKVSMPGSRLTTSHVDAPHSYMCGSRQVITACICCRPQACNCI